VFGGQVPGSSSQNSTFPLFASLNLTAYFDASSDSSNLPTWQELPSANAIPVLNPQCVLTGTHLLVVGGQPLDPALINPFATNTPMTYCGLQSYSFEEQGWQSLMPEAATNSETVFINLNRTGHAASWMTNVGNGQPGLFVMAGIHYNATLPANDAFILSPFTIPALGGQAVIGAASIPDNVPPPTVNSGAAAVNGGSSVIFFGGMELPSQLKPTSIWEYSPSASSWKTLSASLPNGMPNADTGWVSPGNELFVVDMSKANTANAVGAVPLANAGLRRRQISPSSSTPGKLDGSSVAFDPIRNLAIVSGGDGNDQNTLNIFNTTSNSWSVLSLADVNSATPSATSSTPTISSTTSTPSLQSTTGSVVQQPQSSGFNKANLLAPIILGGVVGLLGLLGLTLLLISYYHRKSRKRKQGHTHASMTPAGLWLKYGNRKQEDPVSQALGGEIFLRNLEEKHGLRRDKSAGGDRRKTGWSKYFSTSWYHSSSNNQRGSVSTANTARALVNETRDHTGPYGGGWDAASRVSKASTFLSVASEDTKPGSVEGERFSGSRWSYYKKIRASNASSGVLGSTLGEGTSSIIGAGGVKRL
jgi:hypothetical protein